MNLTIFARRMKKAREDKGMKQNELAKAVGVTPTTISAYEKSDDEGNGKKPTLENAKSIAEALGVSIDWLCGMTESKSSSYTDFTATDYFKSLITVLMETSSNYNETFQGGIALTNPIIIAFSRKISDLIKVYRAGSIPEDLFNVCVDKIINDYNNYTVLGNCILENAEADDADQHLYNLVCGVPDADVGVYEITVSKSCGYGDERKVKIFVSPKMLHSYNAVNEIFSISEEAPDNGNDNPKDK